jgi:hypothetical protein
MFCFISSKQSTSNDDASRNEHHQTPSRNSKSSKRNSSILGGSVIQTLKAGAKKKSKKPTNESKSDSLMKVDEDHESVIQQVLESTLYKSTKTKPNVNSSNLNLCSASEANKMKKEKSTLVNSGRAESTKKKTKRSDDTNKKKITGDLPSQKGILQVVQPESSKLSIKKLTKKK